MKQQPTATEELTSSVSIGSLALASFDVFDTVVGRPYLEPADLHEAVWYLLGKEGLGSIRNAVAWRQVRVDAERDVRRLASGSEVTLRSIYDRLQSVLRCDPADLERAQRLELEQEQRVLRRLAAGHRLVQDCRRKGLSIAYLSDMYLPDQTIRFALDTQSLLGPQDLLMVSSTTGHTKHTGKLFQTLLQNTGLPAHAVQHVGDNAHSDVAVPRGMGIQASLHPVAPLSQRETQLSEFSGADRFIRRAMAGSGRLARLQERGLKGPELEIAEVSAAVAAPLLIGFVLWTLQQAKVAGVRDLYFLARDGQILQRLAVRLAAVVAPEIRPRYLYASRQALYLPALDPSAPDASHVIVRICKGRTARAVETSLRLPAGTVASLLGLGAGASEGPAWRMSEPKCEAFAAALLKSPHCIDVAQAAQSERQALRLYLEQESFFASERAAVVDIGWRGNLQVLLSAALRASEQRNGLLGLYFGLHQAPPKSAGDALSYVTQAARYNEPILELMCAADHGSTVRYVVESGRAVPLLASATNDIALEWGLRLQQRVIEQTCESFVAAVPAQLLCAPIALQALRQLGDAAFSSFHRNPTAAEAEAYGAFPHSADAGHGESSAIAPVMPMWRSLRTFVPGQQHPGTSWAHGSLRRSAARQGLQSLAGAFLTTRAGLGGWWRGMA
jgi:FMN phosphatase YigB (HAD superfamily)